jgi:hypothetical protein
VVDTVVALLNFFFFISHTCLDLSILTDISRHIAMTHAYTALHFADIHEVEKAPSQPHFSPFTFGI